MAADELLFLEKIKKEKQKRLVIVNNKIDLQPEKKQEEYIPEDLPLVETSAVNNTGIEKLKSELLNKVLNTSQPENKESVIITNERHYFALLKAKQCLTSALHSIKTGKSEEFIAIDLRLAIDSIGEIVGLVTTEEILNNIFSRFCIGK
jgi:tRNA modification GTPase